MKLVRMCDGAYAKAYKNGYISVEKDSMFNHFYYNVYNSSKKIVNTYLISERYAKIWITKNLK